MPARQVPGIGGNLSNIKYICLSDIHLGANSAILTDTPAVTLSLPSGEEQVLSPAYSATPLREAFSQALVRLLQDFAASQASTAPAGVVLLGDVLDFSLGRPRSAIDDLDALLKALVSAGAQAVLGDFVFLPGNHDHALWTVARFQRMVGANRQDDDFDHITRAFDGPENHPLAPIIGPVLAENGFAEATTYYPNMGLIRDGRAVVLHHGHFIESAYRVMSTLVAELANQDAGKFSAEALEILNASWIDFMWSTDGDDGKLGAEIMLAYDYLLTGAEDTRFFARLADLIAARIGAALPLPKTAASRKLMDEVSRAVVESLIGHYGQTERFSYAEALDADSRAGLAAYLTGPVLKQLATERAGSRIEDVTFIFGHTHKPFEDRLAIDAFRRPARVYNTGGWDLDTPMFDTMLGAALVFVDDDLNVASLRICDVPRQDGPVAPPGPGFQVHVATAEGTLADNPLALALDRSLAASRQAWADFAAEADRAYRAKQGYIMARLHKADIMAHRKGSVL